jgi:hypothetical protein
MKKALAMALLLGTLRIASAGTTNIYVEDWGTTNGGGAVLNNGTLSLVGWTGVAVSQTTGPYLGIYAASGPTDSATGTPLTTNTVYFTVLLPTQTTPGMFYTTDTAGSGTGGDSSFHDIDPTQYTNLSLSVEVTGNATDTNYFAVRVGPTQWYVSTTALPGSGGAGGTVFSNNVMAYTNVASAWNLLTVGTTNATIGGAPGANLSGNITGIGIVELPTSAGWNYNRLAVTAFASGGVSNTAATITVPPTSQTVYAGGGASFLLLAAGTQPITYIWETNGVQLTDGGRISGSGTNIITITNLQASDASVTYSIIVSNVAPPPATNSSFTLTVSNVPPDFLYAETFPYVGPSGNLPITGVGWVGAFQGNTGIYTSGGGAGNVFSYSGVATTNIYYTTTTNDTGASGLPFVAITPENYPNVTFEANFTPGNGAGLNSSNVVAYWAVQMQDGTWYSSAKRVPVQTTTVGTFQPYQMAFSRVATNWNTVTIGANSATIGGHPGANLAGNITGAGIVITHLGLNGGGDFNFNSFVLTTNPVTVLPPSIGAATPFSQAVPSGGGVSFGVSATGQQPFTYSWTLKGSTLTNGGRISGADTPILTIANVTSNDAGQVIAFVSNQVGTDNSLTEPQGGGFGTDTELTVTNAPIGQLYSETFPYVGPVAGSLDPIGRSGWVQAVSGGGNDVFEIGLSSDGAVFAFRNAPDTTAYYTTSTNDTNQAGVAFPNINLAFYPYPSLNISVDVAPQTNSANVTAYLAMQIGTNWFVAANPLPTPTVDSPTYTTYSTAFNPAAANWKNLSISGTGALIGAPAAGDLKGTMTGAGLVFVTVGAGGTLNFDNFIITGPGIGGITSGPLTGGNLNLSWIANPVVGLQSSTSLSPTSWTDVPGTLGKSSYPAPAAGPQVYFRLASH